MSQRTLAALLLLVSLSGSAWAADDPPRVRLDFGGQFDRYTMTPNNILAGATHLRGSEGSGFVELGIRVSDAVTVIAGYDVAHQIDFIDHRFNAGAYWTALPRLTLLLRGAAAPHSGILPRWEALGEADWQWLDALALIAQVRHLEFHEQEVAGHLVSGDSVTVWSSGLRVGPLSRVTLTFQGGLATHTSTPTTRYLLGRADWQALAPLRLSLGVSRGTESRRPFNPDLVSATTTVTAGAGWAVSDRLGLRVDYAHEEFDREYIRNSASSAMTVRF